MSLVLIHQFMDSILSNSIALTCGITLRNMVLLLIMIANLMSDLIESVVATNSSVEEALFLHLLSGKSMNLLLVFSM